MGRKAPMSLTVIAQAPIQTSAVKMVPLMLDLDKFEEAYKEFSRLTAGVDEVALDRIVAGNTNDDVRGLVLEGGLDTLQTLANVPKTWPLARSPSR